MNQSVKCDNGHLYDPSQYPFCPACARLLLGADVPERFCRLGKPSFLSRGSTCEVFRIDSAPPAVLKVVSCGNDGQKINNALREVRFLQLLRESPAVVPLLDSEQTETADGGTTFFLLEEYHEPLQSFLRRGEHTLDELIGLMLRICRAVRQLIGNGIYHLDLKPGNIFIGSDGNALLSDFGVALFAEELPHKHDVRGTLGYAAPEVLMEGRCSEASEVYSLGQIFYRLMTGGKDPFGNGAEKEEAYRRHVQGEPLPPVRLDAPAELNDYLNAVIAAACRSDPEQRYPSVERFCSRLLMLQQLADETPQKTVIRFDGGPSPADPAAEESGSPRTGAAASFFPGGGRHTDTITSYEPMAVFPSAAPSGPKGAPAPSPSAGAPSFPPFASPGPQDMPAFSPYGSPYCQAPTPVGGFYGAEPEPKKKRSGRGSGFFHFGKRKRDREEETYRQGQPEESPLQPNMPFPHPAYGAPSPQQPYGGEQGGWQDWHLAEDANTIAQPRRGAEYMPSPEEIRAAAVPLRNAARDTEQSWLCVGCGSRMEQGNFCAFCGRPRPARGAGQKLFCGRCGSRLEPGMAFCICCGSRTEESAEERRVSVVEFSAVAPKNLVRGATADIDVMMYEEASRKIVEELIAQAPTPVLEKRSGKLLIRYGAEVTVVLTSPDVAIEDGAMTNVWAGSHLNFSFSVFLPEDYGKQTVSFVAKVYFEGVLKTRLSFTAACSAEYVQQPAITRKDVSSAFVSYSHADRDKVASIVRGMKLICGDIDIFLDVEKLRRGEQWQPALYREIADRDVLYLCWSKNAMASEWVDREWRYAYETKGEEGIEPLPIEPPELCPPPNELADMHWNDLLLYLIDFDEKRKEQK